MRPFNSFPVILKIILPFVLVSLISLGCKNTKRKSQQTETNFWLNKYDSILPGRWSICSLQTADGNLHQYNVCPEILFDKSTVATVIQNNEVSQTFKWQMDSDTLQLTHLAFLSNDSSLFFPDTRYLIGKREDTSFIYITIAEQRIGYIFHLSRIKTK